MACLSVFDATRSTPYRWIGQTDAVCSRTLDVTLSKILYNKLALRNSWRSPIRSTSSEIDMPTAQETTSYALLDLSFSRDGKILVAGSADQNVYVFDPNTGKAISTIKQAHNGPVSCVRYLSDYQFASGSDDSTVAIWDLRRSSEAVNVLRGHKSCIRSLMCNENSGGMLLSSSLDSTLRYWHVPSFQSQSDQLVADNDENQRYRGVLAQCPNLSQACLSPNGECLTIANSRGDIYIVYNLDILNLSQILKTLRLDEGTVMQLAWFNPNCSLTKKNRIRVLSGDDYAPQGQGIINRVRGLTFHPVHCFLLARLSITHTMGFKTTEWTCGVNLKQAKSCYDKTWLTINSFGSEILEEPLMFSRQEEKWDMTDKKLSFGPCGQVFTSPGKSRISLLAFSKNIDDPYTMPLKLKREPVHSVFMNLRSASVCKSFTQVGSIQTVGQVTCAEFSTTHTIIASGDNNGFLHFYQPAI